VHFTTDRKPWAAIPPLTLGLAFLGIGALSIAWRDFALTWQPYPAGLGGRELWGMASGIVAVVGGALTVHPRTRRLGALVLAVFTGLWVLALHGPLVAAKPGEVAGWNGFAEALALSMGALVISRQAGHDARPDTVTSWAIRAFGVACLIFGLAHFVYAKFTASMVPEWLPMRLELAYLTGAVHALTGLAMVTGLRPRLAAGVEGLMMLSFVLLVHLPRVAAKPTDRLELTMLCIAVALSSSAFALAASRR
jgi:uncharacterized membrane protein